MIVNIEDLREKARRRLPRALFDYIDGGAEDEHTLRANQSGFQHYAFIPKVLVDVADRDQSTTIFGERLDSPLIIAPTGFTGMFWPQAEILGAREAAKNNLIFTAGTMSMCSIEQIAAGAPGARIWFQLYVWRDKGLTRSLIERARQAGCKALVITVDTPVLGQRERDIRNGLVIPPRIGFGNLLDALSRPSWMWGILRHPRITFGNFANEPGVKHDPTSLAAFTNAQFSPSVSWADIDSFRSLWSGPLIIKGIMSAADAQLAIEHGADAIAVSNHGGRQCDSVSGAIEVLPEILQAVAGRAELILDGGIRRGSDVVKAIALGARACMIGRAYNYGVAAAGQPGAAKAIEILQTEIDRCLALIGCPRLVDATPSILRPQSHSD
jgi:L-lactate dehydrogenase (cytochrome)